jgi:hypothetical protein
MTLRMQNLSVKDHVRQVCIAITATYNDTDVSKMTLVGALAIIQ